MRRVAMAGRAAKGTLILKQGVAVARWQAREGHCCQPVLPCPRSGRPASRPFFRCMASARAPPPAITRPSVTWGVIRKEAEALITRDAVFEYLSGEGISTAQLAEIELPSAVDVVKERLEFLRNLGVDAADINGYPLMIGCSVRKNMIPVLGYLRKLGIDHGFLPIFLKKYPMVLHASVVIDLMPVIDYLLGLDIDMDDLPGVLLRFPDVLGFRLEGTMSTSVAYLVSFGVKMREIGPMLTEYPEILGMRVASVIKPKVDYLISLGLARSIVARILERRPQLLGYGLNETMKPVIDELLKVGVQKERLADIIVQYPEILRREPSVAFEEKIAWLTRVVKLSPGDVPRVIEKLPQVLFINKPLATERLSFLKRAGFSHADVAKMVADCPQILALSVGKTLNPSLGFLKHGMGRTIKELVDFPAFFTYSLESRIQPRFKAIADKGIRCSLSWLLNCSDHKFNQRLNAGFVETEGAGPSFKMGGRLVVGSGRLGKEQVATAGPRTQRIYARERLDSARMDYSRDRSESEEGEDDVDEEVDDVMGISSDGTESEDEDEDEDEDVVTESSASDDEDTDGESELPWSEEESESSESSPSEGMDASSEEEDVVADRYGANR